MYGKILSMNIKNLAELQKSRLTLVLHTRQLGSLAGTIERIDLQAQTVIFKTENDTTRVIEAADIVKIEIH